MSTRLLRPLAAHLGSLRSTLVLMALLAAVVLAGTTAGRTVGAALVAVLALLALNLGAALVVHPAFRRQLPLLLAHLGLLGVVVLAGLGRLLSLDGHFELTQGVPFDGSLIDQRAGALHHDRLHALTFRHDGFDIDYAPGRRRGATRNRVSWTGADGRAQSATIGDHRPLLLHGHRIYTSPNKGFAPLLRWQPARGAAVVGSVHLPSYPLHELQQSREWTLPDRRTAWVMLQLDETLIDPATAGSFRMPHAHHLVLRLADRRVELRPGDAVELDGGTLVYDELRTWMGYRVSFDPTLPWLLAAALLAAAGLLWHYVARFGRAPAAQPASGPRALDIGMADG